MIEDIINITKEIDYKISLGVNLNDLQVKAVITPEMKYIDYVYKKTLVSIVIINSETIVKVYNYNKENINNLTQLLLTNKNIIEHVNKH